MKGERVRRSGTTHPCLVICQPVVLGPRVLSQVLIWKHGRRALHTTRRGRRVWGQRALFEKNPCCFRP